MKESTTLTVTISIPLDELKKALAFYNGKKNWRRIKKSDVAEWVSGLAEADITCDLDRALNKFE